MAAFEIEGAPQASYQGPQFLCLRQGGKEEGHGRLIILLGGKAQQLQRL